MKSLEDLSELYATHDERRRKAILRHEPVTARREHIKALIAVEEAFKEGFSFDEIWYAVENVERARGGLLR